MDPASTLGLLDTFQLFFQSVNLHLEVYKPVGDGVRNN
jgi:hypothetical protein